MLTAGSIGVGDGRGSEGTCSPQQKNGEKYFRAITYYVKFGHFPGKNRVEFGNFVKFSGKYNKNSGILIIFRARIV